MYKEEPDQNALAEYHEVFPARLEQEFGLIDFHGWWDDKEGKPHFNRQILSEPHKTEAEADAATEKRIAWLESQGWTIKLTSYFDPHQMKLVVVRLPPGP
jgi:hypothetical protein